MYITSAKQAWPGYLGKGNWKPNKYEFLKFFLKQIEPDYLN